jgi:hypothetical protein
MVMDWLECGDGFHEKLWIQQDMKVKVVCAADTVLIAENVPVGQMSGSLRS